MDLWNRLTHRTDVPTTPPAAHLSRDPDLDAMHEQQHDLMAQSGYTSARIRDSWNERLRESWRPVNGGS